MQGIQCVLQHRLLRLNPRRQRFHTFGGAFSALFLSGSYPQALLLMHQFLFQLLQDSIFSHINFMMALGDSLIHRFRPRDHYLYRNTHRFQTSCKSFALMSLFDMMEAKSSYLGQIQMIHRQNYCCFIYNYLKLGPTYNRYYFHIKVLNPSSQVFAAYIANMISTCFLPKLHH